MNQSTPNFKTSRTGKFFIVPASYWSKIKTVIPGKSGKPQDERWTENELIRQVRAGGGIFVNDKFIGLWDITVGLMFLDGGYGSSKTTYAITRLLVKCMENDYFKCFYGRQKKTEARELHSNIITEIKRNGWGKVDLEGKPGLDLFDYSEKPNGSTEIVYKKNGNKFQLFGCDDDDSLKGLNNPTDILIDEINQISFESFGMLYTRLRGMGYETQLIGCFNNCDVYKGHWLRKYIYTIDGGGKAENQEENDILTEILGSNIVRHHSDYTHNLFQNPDDYYNKLRIKAGFDDVKTRAFALGEWGVSLNAQPFYKGYNSQRQVQICEIEGYRDYNPRLPLHISWDENRNPYLPVIIAQIVGMKIYVIEEIAAENPYNNIMWVCNKITQEYYYQRQHRAGMFIYGDATSKKGDTKLEEGKNFFTLLMEHLSKFDPELCISDSNPNVAMRGDFMNAIFRVNYERIEVIISPKCVHLDDDLKNCPEDPDGKGKDKTKTTVKGKKGVQRWGHFSDCLDYLVCKVFIQQYLLFQNGGQTYDVSGGGRVVHNTISKADKKPNVFIPNRYYIIGDEVFYQEQWWLCMEPYSPGLLFKECFELRDAEDFDWQDTDSFLSYGRRISRNGY